MDPQFYNLNWEDHVDHFRNVLNDMKKTNQFTDVTLVCDDQIQIRAHKIILCAGSSVFSQIIGSLPKNDPVIFLRGVQHQEMESLLEFLYIGQTNVAKERLKEFLDVSKSLDIREISNATEYQSEVFTDDKPEIEDPAKDISQTMNSTVLDNDDGNPFMQILKSEEKKVKKENKVKKEKKVKNKSSGHVPDQKLNECPHCDYKSVKSTRIRKHIESKHDGVTFGCDKCELRFSNNSNLRKHIRVVHLGQRFSCSECDYQNGQKINLKNHMKSKHDIVSQ